MTVFHQIEKSLKTTVFHQIEISIQKSKFVLTNPVDGVKEEQAKQQQPSQSCLADLKPVNAENEYQTAGSRSFLCILTSFDTD